MNKIDQLLKDIQNYSKNCNHNFFYIEEMNKFQRLAVQHIIKDFCRNLVEEARYLTSGDTIEEFLENYLNPKSILETTKVTISTLKNFNYDEVLIITGVNLFEAYENDYIIEITKEQFNELLK